MFQGNRKGRKKEFNNISLKHVETVADVPVKSREIIYSVIMACIGFVGASNIWMKAMDFGINIFSFNAVMCVICILMVLCMSFSKVKKIACFVFWGILLVTAILLRKSIFYSMVSSINVVSYEMMGIQLISMPEYEKPELFILMASLVTAFAVAYCVTGKKNIFAAAFFSFSGFVFLLVFNIMPDYLPVVISLAFFLSVCAIRSTEKNRMYASRAIGIYVVSAVFAAGIIIWAAFPPSGFERSKQVAELGRTVQILMNEKFTNINQRLRHKDGMKAFAGISGGRIGHIDSIHITNENRFSVVTYNTGKPQYLKGFTGADYKDNFWSDASRINSESVLYPSATIQGTVIDSNNQQAVLLRILENDSDVRNYLKKFYDEYLGTKRIYEMSVKELNLQGKYSYFPYGTTKAMMSSGQENPDLMFNESYIVYDTDSTDYDRYKSLSDNYGKQAVLGSTYKKYSEWEKGYRAFVYDAYTAVEESMLPGVKEMLSGNELKTAKEKLEFVESVKNYFSEHYTYTLNPGKVPEGRELTEYFLYDSKEGYCTYFATSAAIIFRIAGIPSRYVEGYVISEKNFFNAQSGEGAIKTYRDYNVLSKSPQWEYTINITDAEAHAWVEIYMDGFGWIPVDVTPGSNSFEQENENSGDLSNQEKETQSLPIENEEENNQNLAENNEESISSETSHDNFENSEAEKENRNENDRYMMLLIVVLALILGASFIRQRNKTKYLLSAENISEKIVTEKQVYELFEYFVKLCRFVGFVKMDYSDYRTFAEYLKDYRQLFSDADINVIINIIEKQKFSNETITNHEMIELKNNIKILSDNIYASLNHFEKLKFKYFSHL